MDWIRVAFSRCVALFRRRRLDTFEQRVSRLSPGGIFSTSDREDTPLVALVNQAFVRRYFHGEDPINMRVNLAVPPGIPFEDPWLRQNVPVTVIGLISRLRIA